jgi:8-oxo-dGTP pyrophosphatase MutT (NUDIX family)
VFPGGNYEKGQDVSLGMTAIREAFEESGILLASSISPGGSASPISDAILDEGRVAIHSNKISFPDFLTKHNLRADVDSLLPFTQWITPTGPPRCV